MMSPNSAVKAEKLGYTNVRVYHDGLPVWKKEKNLVLSSAASLASYIEKGIPYVAIDLRPAAKLSGGVIPGAVNISAEGLDKAMAEMPKQKAAPIILYSDNAAEAEAAFATVRGWGYKNAVVLQGGIDAWTAMGSTLMEKPLDKIAYEPKPRPGSIAIDKFKDIAAGKDPGAIILDVRGADETAEGMISGAINIPVTELEARTGELPKDKTIVAQCNTGVQAEMAYTVLKEAGLNALFLYAAVDVDDDGTFEIEELAEN